MTSLSAPPADSTSTPTSWVSLPSDVLVETFRLIPVRPRLLVVSQVCRRWRHAAVTSIDALPDELAPRLDDAASALFVNLREAHVATASEAEERRLTPERCAKLRSLTISSAGLLPHNSAHCTALQRLSLTAARSRATDDLLASLLRRNAATITSLTLNTVAPWDARSERDQPTLHALRTLDLSAIRQVGAELTAVLTCVLLHSPTLTSLSVTVGDPDLLCALSLPRLTALNAGINTMTHAAVT